MELRTSLKASLRTAVLASPDKTVTLSVSSVVVGGRDVQRLHIGSSTFRVCDAPRKTEFEKGWSNYELLSAAIEFVHSVGGAAQ